MQSPFTINLDYQQISIIANGLIGEINRVEDSSMSPQFKIYTIVKTKSIAKRLLNSVSKTAQRMDANGQLNSSEKEILITSLNQLKDIQSYKTFQCLEDYEIKNFNAIEFLSSVDLNEFNEKDEPELYDLCVKQMRNIAQNTTEVPEDDGSRDWWDSV